MKIVGSDWGKFVAIAVICVFIFIVAFGMLIPIYADEVSTKITQATIFEEGWKLRTLIPQCLPAMIIDPPLSWVPAAIVYSIVYHWISPLGVRLTSVAMAFCWLALSASVVCIFVGDDKKGRLLVGAMLAAVAGLGVLPLTFVLARAEQWLLLLLTFFVLFPFWMGRLRIASQIIQGVLSLGIFCLATSLLFFTHVKAIFFLPFLVVSAWFGFRRLGIAFFAIGALFIGVCAFQTLVFAETIFRCEGAPILGSFFASHTTKLSLFLVAPIAVLSEMFSNFINAPVAIGKHLVYQNVYQSLWLPSSPSAEQGVWTLALNDLLKVVFVGVYLLAALLPPWVGVTALRKKRMTVQMSLLVSLWIGFVGHLALYRTWNFYGGALVFGLALLLLLMSFALSRGLDGASIAPPAWLYVPLFSIFLVSAIVLMGSVGWRLIKVAGTAGVGLSDQPLSVPVFGFLAQRERIRVFAQSCGIDGDGVRRLVIDDLTYFAFDNLKEPIHLVYLYEGGFGADIKGEPTRKLLADLNAYGIVAQCTFMPALLLENVRKEGNLCCVKFPLKNVSR